MGASTVDAREREATSSRAPRGPKPAHSRERIAKAAVTIADAEGIDAASMRRVAAEIGTRATSLYRYVLSRDDLLDNMVEIVMGETPVPRLAGEWRPDLRAIAHHMRAMIKRHPWMVSISARSTFGPNSLATTEAMLTAVDGHGLDADGMLVVVTALSTFTRGYAAEEIAEQQAEIRSGLSREQWMMSQAQLGQRIRESGKYPLVTRIIDEAKTPHEPKFVRQGFERGLECLLDGVAARLSKAKDDGPVS